AGLFGGIADQQVRAPGPVGQEQPRLFERLAQRGHPVGQPAALDAQQDAGVGVGPPLADRLGLRAAVDRIHAAAGEDVGPAHEVGLQVASDHEHLERALALLGFFGIAHQHHCRRWADHHLIASSGRSLRGAVVRHCGATRTDGIAGRFGGHGARLPVRSRAPPERPGPSSTLRRPMSLDTPEHAESPALHAVPRRYVALGLIVLAIVLVAALIVIRNADQTDDTSDVETVSPAPSSVITALAHVPRATSAAVGVTSPTSPITSPTATGNAPLWESTTPGSGPRPVVFFYGAEFAPYAAAERWPLIVALSRFGTFGSLGLMQSSSSVAFSGTPTFTFWHATYSSVWVDLQAVERYSSLNPTGGGYTTLQTP